MNNEFSNDIAANPLPSGQEKNEAEDEEFAAAEEESYLAPSRWWFASTAFPLIAGTFGPMASAFSICALVVRWRENVPDGLQQGQGTIVDDPLWLTAINAVQLAIAVISNLALLLNMAKRISFEIAQPITIVGWYVSSFTLIGLCSTAAGPLRPGGNAGNYTLTAAFYYAIFAAVLYFLVASLMVVTVFGAYAGHYAKDFNLTTSQRTLMLQTISFLVYLLSGAAVYAHIEDWNYLDAVYFADYTLLTVGIGNLAPGTHLGRSLLFPFAIGGIIILGLVIGSIRSLVLERGKVKLEARLIERERIRTIKKCEKKGHASLLVPVDSNANDKTEDAHLQERERRREEFELMRRVQANATERERWLALGISGTTWFTLWFVGAAIFEAAETDQEWSYFDALYFAYVSLLTIGYGDLYPQSNSGKSFFVFWSLLAIPSLTILISNMGDTVVKGIRDLTLWIGTLTVLPGEGGIRLGIKKVVYKLTKGKIFEGDISEQPPGFLGEAQKRDMGDDGVGQGRHFRKDDPESNAGRADKAQARRGVDKAKNRGKKNDVAAGPKSRKHYHVILIKEIGEVIKHLSHSPPRKYTFDEWAWYLKLIGEDESDAHMHRRAPLQPGQDAVGIGEIWDTNASKDERQRVQWSWIGHRSPLMGDKEEAEWVLERLTKTLERELKEIQAAERLRKGKGNTDDKKSSGRNTTGDDTAADSEEDSQDEYDDMDDVHSMPLQQIKDAGFEYATANDDNPNK